MKRQGIVRSVWGVLLLAAAVSASAARSRWETHFAYNSVAQIAVTEDETYALANGAIFSVNKTTEALTKYDSRDGLHGTQVVCIAYDKARKQLLIMYEDGRMDILRDGRMHYVPDLYSKKMTSSKKCNNITIADDKAYLSMEFGILLFDLERYEFRDACYIGKNAAEVQVLDVVLQGDSIYAKTADKYYCAALQDNVVDYHYWQERDRVSVPFDTDKGKNITEPNGNVWMAKGTQGVYRKTVTGEETHYLPEGPQVNVPYRMTADRGRLYVVQGGRWASQYSRAGHVMMYDSKQWTNITQSAIRAKTGKAALDFMDIAVDPEDEDHFFVTSYGTGLYEFRGTELVKHYTPSNSILRAAAPNNPDKYTRVEGATYDREGRLWVMVSGVTDTLLVAFLPDGKTQRGLMVYKEDGSPWSMTTTGGLVADNYREHCKWLMTCRAGAAVVMVDDAGTPFDANDDKTIIRSEWYDQDNQPIVPEFLYTMVQADNGDIWVGSNIGPIIIDRDADYLTSPVCRRLRIGMPDGTYLLESDQVNAFAFDSKRRIWIGTQTAGVYVLDDAATQIVTHYTSDDTPMPSNAVLSLAYDDRNDIMFIGTGAGLVSYKLSPDTSTNLIDTSEENWTYGTMHQWRAHFAYSSIDEVAVMGNSVYALSGGALFSVDKQSEEITYHNRLTGLTSSGISHIGYNPALGTLLIMYENGHWDIINRRGEVSNIADLYLKPLSGTKAANDVVMIGDKAYIAMTFGIVVLDMARQEVQDTYYIGNEAAEVDVKYLALVGDTIYACTTTALYMARLGDNLADFVNWQQVMLPRGTALQGMESLGHTVCVLRDDSLLYSLENSTWVKHSLGTSLYKLCKVEDRLFGLPQAQSYVREIKEDYSLGKFVDYGFVCDIAKDGNTYWLGTRANGLVRVSEGSTQEFHPEGPQSNISYRLRFCGDRLYVLSGGRWASQFNRQGLIMYYEDNRWTNISNAELVGMTNHVLLDFMNVAQDPKDKDHYFITTYGTGMLEMQGKQAVKLHLPANSPLGSAVAENPDYFTRTDGAMYDEQGNMWVLNMSDKASNVHVVSPDGQWHSFNLYDSNGGGRITLNATGEIMVDKRNAAWKWIPVCRRPDLVLLQDNGTPANPQDDKVVARKEWVDQQGKSIRPAAIYTIAQDQNNDIWVGTNEGIFIIPASVDFTTSNQCRRVIIPRNDGSNLGDYLLDKEQINCIVVDGNNRKWIGTEASGVYLIDVSESMESGWNVETVAHFTTTNSLLPSDNVLSIAIQPSTGEVFIGTSAGLVSYMSDAVEPADNFDNIYAYPNPVHPNYKGYITIKGIMEDTEVRITDAGGNLVKKIQGTGGEVVWDGTNTVGKRVASGVYTVIGNTKDGSGHGTTKILIMN